MIRFLIFFLILIFPLFSNPINKANCMYKGVKLYGRVQFVKFGADFRAEVTKGIPDLIVDKTGKYNPNQCGYWEIVNHSPDFTIELVTYGADFTIMFSTSSPGVYR